MQDSPPRQRWDVSDRLAVGWVGSQGLCGCLVDVFVVVLASASELLDPLWLDKLSSPGCF